MKHPARWIALGIGVVIVAFSVVLATQVGNDPRVDAKKSQLAGRDAPQFTVETIDGRRLSSSDLAGKSVIVNFWNTWCAPCREEHPALQKFYARHADDPDFEMVAIVRDDTERAVRRWVDDKRDGWIVAFDPGGKAALAFGTRGQPETFAISPDGVVVGYQLGASSVGDLETLLDATRGVGS
jgi:cytochrome c biogenesis protein CcmG/thiol:disulfide interchange protein DsbE